ncbi:1076_t:CDS:1, partial [Gigaspora margarita]
NDCDAKTFTDLVIKNTRNTSTLSLSNLNLEYDFHLATTLIRNLNHPSFDKYFLKIRLQEIQDFAATNVSILSELSFISPIYNLTS